MQATVVCRALQLAIVQRQPVARLIVCIRIAVVSTPVLPIGTAEQTWLDLHDLQYVAARLTAGTTAGDGALLPEFEDGSRLVKLGNLPFNAFERKSAIKQLSVLCEKI